MFNKADWPKILQTPSTGPPAQEPFTKNHVLEEVSKIDFSKPPPNLKPWVASAANLEAINKSIITRHG